MVLISFNTLRQNNMENKNIPEQPPEQKENLFLKLRYKIQAKLMEKICDTPELMQDLEKRNACALVWIDIFADNFDQLDNGLLERYNNAQDESEKENILADIQKSLEILNAQNG